MELKKIFDYVQANKQALGPEATQFGAATALHEFVSEIFANEKLRAKLNSIRPDGKVSLLQRFTDAVLKLLIGDRAAIMRPGSMLGNAIRQAINVAGSPSVADLARVRSLRCTSEGRVPPGMRTSIPTFRRRSPTLSRPWRTTWASRTTDQIERELDHEAAFYAEEERAAVEADVDKMAGGINATQAEIKDVKKRMED